MKVIEATAFAIDGLRIADKPRPGPRRGEMLVRICAASLNYRDLAVLSGSYLPDLPLPYVPLSDACGVVEAVGDDVSRFRAGDRVIPAYIRGWHDGALTPEQRQAGTLGGPLPGVLQQYIVVPADDAVAAPPHLSDAEASTLPIAALTAWSCLVEGGVLPGQTVLVQGTGGVSLFGLQLARTFGARVIALTSSGQKEALLRQLGADEVVNYHDEPDWAAAVREATGGRGADIVIETTGNTLDQSLKAVAFGGFVAVVGFVGGFETALNIRQLIGPMVRMQGIVVGSRKRLEDMIRAMTLHRLQPVIDWRFDFNQAPRAFKHMQSGAHVGKVVVQVDW